MIENKKYIIANWKMNPADTPDAEKLFSAISENAAKQNQEVIACPPFVYIPMLRAMNGWAQIGAQNCHWEETGPFTGEISAHLLSQFGVKYILVGHSERRYGLNETDEMINKKIHAVLARHLRPVLFVGEKEKGEYRQDIIIDQLSRDLEGVSQDQLKSILIVYEPVWAISSNSGGESDTLESALESIHIIKRILVKMFGEAGNIVPILYGGSVNPENAASFLSHPEISGAVVGASSLDAEKFKKILEINNLK